ncbi:MAG TPA: glycosyl hydrolase family 28 protein, partial [Spirochaetia bacterium]|nr:glycosyl hydrolase family 28 protein [Spirochaetia bacterium]
CVYPPINRSLIYAAGCESIAITGGGTIDGQGERFPREEESQRPALIRLRDCRGVRLEGLLLKDYPAWGVHPVHCKGLRVTGLRIDSLVRPNNDGLDIDGCQEVFVSDCTIRSSDDSIALKALQGPEPCRDIVVTNCILTSRCAAIRLGPDAVSPIERVSVSNCVIRDTVLNGIKIQESLGSVMRDIVFSNIVMDNVGGPISIRCAGWKKGASNVWAVFEDTGWEKGEVSGVLFQNIRARVMPGNTPANPKMGISITGTSRTRPRGVAFSGVDISFPGGGTAAEGARRDVPDLEQDYPECYMFGVLPAYGLYAHHADGITLHDIRFRLDSEDLRPAVVCVDVRDVELSGVRAESCREAEAVLRLQNAAGAFVTGSGPLGACGTFLRVEGRRSRDIRVVGNDLGQAPRALELDRDAAPSAVTGPVS